MKAFILVALFVGVGLASPTARKQDVISRVFHGIDFSQNPLCSEPTPDPNQVPAGTWNLILHPILSLDEGSNHGGLDMSGHSGLTTDVQVNIITLTATFDVQLPDLHVLIHGHKVDGYLDLRPLTCIPSGNFSGEGTGEYIAHVGGLHVAGSATLFINLISNKVSIRLLSVSTFTFDTLCMDLGPNFTIGGSTPDWTALCANVKPEFDAEWANAAIRNAVVEKFRVGANVIVGQYTLEELIDLISKPDEPPCTTVRA